MKYFVFVLSALITCSSIQASEEETKKLENFCRTFAQNNVDIRYEKINLVRLPYYLGNGYDLGYAQYFQGNHLLELGIAATDESKSLFANYYCGLIDIGIGLLVNKRFIDSVETPALRPNTVIPFDDGTNFRFEFTTEILVTNDLERDRLHDSFQSEKEMPLQLMPMQLLILQYQTFHDPIPTKLESDAIEQIASALRAEDDGALFKKEYRIMPVDNDIEACTASYTLLPYFKITEGIDSNSKVEGYNLVSYGIPLERKYGSDYASYKGVSPKGIITSSAPLRWGSIENDSIISDDNNAEQIEIYNNEAGSIKLRAYQRGYERDFLLKHYDAFDQKLDVEGLKREVNGSPIEMIELADRSESLLESNPLCKAAIDDARKKIAKANM